MAGLYLLLPILDVIVMLMAMQRDYNESVTPSTVPILVETEGDSADGWASFETGLAGLMRVKSLTQEALELFVENAREFERRYGQVPKHKREHLIALLNLAYGLVRNDEHAIDSALRRFETVLDATLDIRLLKRVHDPQRYLARRLSEELSQELSSARLVLWWSGTQFLPGIYCRTTATALYALALVSVVGGQSLGVCLRCGNVFVKKGKRDYCSLTCQSAHRQARHRARKKRAPDTAKEHKKKSRKRRKER